MTGDPWLAATNEAERPLWLAIVAAHARPADNPHDIVPATCPLAGDRAVFDDEDDARAAAADLHEAGAPLLQPEPCEHSDHWHLIGRNTRA